MEEKKFDFRPKGPTWEERSLLGGDKAVLDPVGSELKNNLIDRLQKRALDDVIHSIGKRECCLDFGCGVGRLHDCFAKWFFFYYGVDVTASMIKKASDMYTGKFYVYDGLNLPISDATIDVVLSVLVLQHINNPVEYEKIVTEFKRVTKKEGYVVFIEQLGENRTKDHYVKPFEKNGFSLQKFGVIRRGRSISSWLSSRKLCNTFEYILPLLMFINGIEVLFPAIKKSYEECIFVFRKDY